MKLDVRPTGIFVAASSALAAFASIVAAVTIAREGLGANAAAWVQAAGAIAAITGAVWLFQADTRLRRRERRKEREVVAWGVQFAIQQAQFEIWEICDRIPSDTIPTDIDRPREWRIQTTCAKSILQHYVSRADHIHPDLIRMAMNGFMLLEEFELQLARVEASWTAGELPEPEVLDRITSFKVFFHELLVLFHERMRGVLLALDAGGDELPVTDLTQWRVAKNGHSTSAEPSA